MNKADRVLNLINEKKVDKFDRVAMIFFLQNCFSGITPERLHLMLDTYKIMYGDESKGKKYKFFNKFSKIVDNSIGKPFEDRYQFSNILYGLVTGNWDARAFIHDVNVLNSNKRRSEKKNEGFWDFISEYGGISPSLKERLNKALDLQGLSWKDVFNI